MTTLKICADVPYEGTPSEAQLKAMDVFTKGLKKCGTACDTSTQNDAHGKLRVEIADDCGATLKTPYEDIRPDIDGVTPEHVADLLEGSANWYLASLVGRVGDGGRKSAIGVITSVVSDDLMPIYDSLYQEWDEEGSYKNSVAGSLETFEDWWEDDASECWREDFDEEDHESMAEAREDWRKGRLAWLKSSQEDLDTIANIVGACRELALQHNIPFSADMIKAQARVFAESHPQWNSSKCW